MKFCGNIWRDIYVPSILVWLLNSSNIKKIDSPQENSIIVETWAEERNNGRHSVCVYVWRRKAVQGPRIQVTAFAGSGTVNRTPLQRQGIRTSSINRTRNVLICLTKKESQQEQEKELEREFREGEWKARGERWKEQIAKEKLKASQNTRRNGEGKLRRTL